MAEISNSIHETKETNSKEARELFNKLFEIDYFQHNKSGFKNNEFALILGTRETNNEKYSKIISYNKSIQGTHIFRTLSYNPKNGQFHYYSEESKLIKGPDYINSPSYKLEKQFPGTKSPLFKGSDDVPVGAPKITEEKAIKIMKGILKEIETAKYLENILKNTKYLLSSLKIENQNIEPV